MKFKKSVRLFHMRRDEQELMVRGSSGHWLPLHELDNFIKAILSVTSSIRIVPQLSVAVKIVLNCWLQVNLWSLTLKILQHHRSTLVEFVIKKWMTTIKQFSVSPGATFGFIVCALVWQKPHFTSSHKRFTQNGCAISVSVRRTCHSSSSSHKWRTTFASNQLWTLKKLVLKFTSWR